MYWGRSRGLPGRGPKSLKACNGKPGSVCMCLLNELQTKHPLSRGVCFWRGSSKLSNPRKINRLCNRLGTQGHESIGFRWFSVIEIRYDYQGCNLRFCGAPSSLVVLLSSFVRFWSHDQFGSHSLASHASRDSKKSRDSRTKWRVTTNIFIFFK